MTSKTISIIIIGLLIAILLCSGCTDSSKATVNTPVATESTQSSSYLAIMETGDYPAEYYQWEQESLKTHQASMKPSNPQTVEVVIATNSVWCELRAQSYLLKRQNELLAEQNELLREMIADNTTGEK